jgi:hypothetical protein
VSIGFSIFPNPAKNDLTVTHPAGDRNSYIKLAQTDGKVVLTQKITSGSFQSILDISKLVPGIYLLTVNSDKTTITFKLMKE